MAQAKEILIIGGGIAGVSLAYFLEQQGAHPIIIEKRDSIGGVSQTIQKNGFILELGPNSTVADECLFDLVRAAGLSEFLIFPSKDSSARYLGLRRNGLLHLEVAPRGPLSLLRSSMLSIPEVLRIFLEPIVRREHLDDEVVQDFISRRFGHGASRLVDTALGGIWAADTTALSARSALPTLWQLDQNSCGILFGLLKLSRKRGTRKYVSFLNGMGSFTELLASKLRHTRIICSATTKTLEPSGEGIILRYQLANDTQHEHILHGAKCCISGSAEDTARLLPPANDELKKLISSIPHAPLGVIHLAIPDHALSRPLAGFGALIPPKDPSAVIGVIFNSSIFPNRAPAGQHLFTCFVGGATKPSSAEVFKPEVQLKVVAEVQELLCLRSAPEIIHQHYYSRAIPNYALGHFQIQEAVNAFHRQQSKIHLFGSWIDGISFASRIQAAKNAAHALTSIG